MDEYQQTMEQKRMKNCTCSSQLECAEFMERYIDIIFNPKLANQLLFKFDCLYWIHMIHKNCKIINLIKQF